MSFYLFWGINISEVSVKFYEPDVEALRILGIQARVHKRSDWFSGVPKCVVWGARAHQVPVFTTVWSGYGKSPTIVGAKRIGNGAVTEIKILPGFWVASRDINRRAR